MKYLSIDLEATGLREYDYIIEFALIPFDASNMKLEEEMGKSYLIKCPPFSELKAGLDPWVIEHNEGLISQACNSGMTISDWKKDFEGYLNSDLVQKYFNHEKIILFGKSMNAIDLPFLNRDLGWNFMRKYFSHRTLDLTSFVYGLIDLNLLTRKMESGSNLMEHLGMGEVKHTAYEDAKNTALMYLKLLEKYNL